MPSKLITMTVPLPAAYSFLPCLLLRIAYYLLKIHLNKRRTWQGKCIHSNDGSVRMQPKYLFFNHVVFFYDSLLILKRHFLDVIMLSPAPARKHE